MYTLNQLEIFKLVAELGSFNMAAEKAYMTPSAVMKNINVLEKEVGIRLFSRTHRGQQLTYAGMHFYENAKKILEMCESSVNKAKEMAQQNERIIKIGTSVMSLPQSFGWLWQAIKEKHPDIQFEIVPYDNMPNSDGSLVPEFNDKIDFIVSTFEDSTLKIRGVNGIEIMKVPLCAVLSVNHRLAEKEMIDPEDFAGETLMVIKKGDSSSIDEFCGYISSQEKIADVEIEEIFSYSADIYNRCAHGSAILIGIYGSGNIHPLIKRIPINWPKLVSLGLLYAKEPRAFVKEFMDIVKSTIGEEGITD